ncbi:MAG TPA: DUF4157 domain-containing protein [Rhizomicrobium sp.]
MGSARAAVQSQGHAAVQRQTAPRQATVEPAGTRFEREADALAVSAMDGGRLPAYSLMAVPAIQRKCKCGGNASGGGQCDSCREKERVQTKLKVAEPGDALERQADRIADQVTKTHAAEGDVHQGGVHEPVIARRAAPGSAPEAGGGAVDAALAQPGAVFSGGARRDMERRFGHDFSHVRVHTGSAAVTAAQALNARAFTYGHGIYFGEGQYNPGTAEGRHLIAHELAHVLQQSPAIHRDPKDEKSSEPDFCYHGYRRGVNVKNKDTVYAIMMNGKDGDTIASLREREWPLWVDWRYGNIPAEEKSSILSILLGAMEVSQEASKTAIKSGCQYAYLLTLETYARLNKIGDKNRKPPDQDTGDGKSGDKKDGGDKGGGDGAGQLDGGGGTGQAGGGGVFAGQKKENLPAPVPEEDATIGIGQAAKEAEKIQHSPTDKVQVDTTVFEKDAKLSQHLLDSLEHFAGRPVTDADKQAASDGLTNEELETIIGGKASYRMLAYVYSQGWNEYKKAGGKDTDPFFILEEAILEQLARGNPTAATNKLEIGKGSLPGEENTIGIRDRDQGWLLYDETGTPFPAFSGMGYRDHGYVGSRVKPDGGVLDSFQINIAAIKDPGLRELLNSLRMTISDPTRVTLQAAEFIFENVDILKDGIIQQVPAKIREGVKESLKYFVGFLAGEAASGFMIRSGNPTLAAVGLALKALLTAAEYVMDVEMIGDVVEMLHQAGIHLAKVEKRADGSFTKLSARHLHDAEAPIVEILTQIGMMGGLKLAGKAMGIIARLRGGGKASIHCSFCSISDAVSDAEAKATDTKTDTPAPETKTDTPAPEAKTDTPPPQTKTDAPSGETKTDTPKTDAPTADTPKADGKTEGKADPSKPDAVSGDTGAVESPRAKWETAKKSFDAAQASASRFKNLAETLAAARKKLQAAKDRQAIQRGGNLETNAGVRDANAQIAQLLSVLKEEFGVNGNDKGAMDAKQQQLNGDFKQAKDNFTPLDVQMDPMKYRAKLPCFAAGTDIATPAGPRPIETLGPGDRVMAFDFAAGRFVSAPVLDRLQATTERLVHIGVAGQWIAATGRHPFWVEDMERWIEARALKPGMRLKTADGARPVDDVRFADVVEAPTYNLQVEGLSSFCVGPGVLVHNEGVDAGQGGSYIIYQLTNPAMPGKVYVGQTTTAGKSGQARGTSARLDEHVKEAAAEIDNINAELAKNPPPDVKAKLEAQLDFFNFKKGAKIETLVYGIGNQAQADWLEQKNIDNERQLLGDDNVVNRRDQISKERIQEARDEIAKDPKVKCE